MSDRLRALWRWILPEGIGKWERALRLLGLVGFLVLAVRSYRSAVKGSYDFDGFWRAGRYVLENGLLTDDSNVARYLPHFQVLNVPFALLPVGVAGLLWYLLSVAALFATPREIERLSGVSARAQMPAWFVALPLVIDNLHLGQSGILILFATLWAVNRARAGSSLVGGAVLGLAAVYKIPALALAAPVLLLGRPVRAMLGVALSGVLVTGLLTAAVGWQETRDQQVQWAEYVRTEQTPAGMVKYDHSLRHNNQSVAISLARTFGKMSARKRRGAPALARLPLETVWTIASAISGLLALIGLACAIRAVRRRGESETWLVITSLAALGMLFVSPLVWTHYFLFALPGLVALRARPRTYVTIGVVVIAGLAVGVARDVGFHVWLCVALYLTLAIRFLRGGAAHAPSPSAGSAPAAE